MKKPLKTYRYSQQFKQEVLAEVNHRNLTVSEAARYYGVCFQTIYNWLKKQGYSNPSREVYYVSTTEKNDLLKKYEALLKENQQLKDAVSKLSLDKLCLEKVIEVAEREYDVDFKKKSGSSASKQSEKK